VVGEDDEYIKHVMEFHSPDELLQGMCSQVDYIGSPCYQGCSSGTLKDLHISVPSNMVFVITKPYAPGLFHLQCMPESELAVRVPEPTTTIVRCVKSRDDPFLFALLMAFTSRSPS
jgi:hypothetical protein